MQFRHFWHPLEKCFWPPTSKNPRLAPSWKQSFRHPWRQIYKPQNFGKYSNWDFLPWLCSRGRANARIVGMLSLLVAEKRFDCLPAGFVWPAVDVLWKVNCSSTMLDVTASKKLGPQRLKNTTDRRRPQRSHEYARHISGTACYLMLGNGPENFPLLSHFPRRSAVIRILR